MLLPKPFCHHRENMWGESHGSRIRFSSMMLCLSTDDLVTAPWSPCPSAEVSQNSRLTASASRPRSAASSGRPLARRISLRRNHLVVGPSSLAVSAQSSRSWLEVMGCL